MKYLCHDKYDKIHGRVIVVVEHDVPHAWTFRLNFIYFEEIEARFPDGVQLGWDYVVMPLVALKLILPNSASGVSLDAILSRPQKLPDAEDRRDYGGSDQPRDYRPIRNGHCSATVYATQFMMVVPCRFIESTCAIFRHA
jgi:hypothetical protein